MPREAANTKIVVAIQFLSSIRLLARCWCSAGGLLARMVDEFGHALGVDVFAVFENAHRHRFRKLRCGVLRADLRDRFDADDDSRGDQRAGD